MLNIILELCLPIPHKDSDFQKFCDLIAQDSATVF